MWHFYFQYNFRSYRSTADLVYLIELLGFLIDLMLVKLQHLIYRRLLTEFGMPVFFTNLSIIDLDELFGISLFSEIQARSGSEWEIVTRKKFLNIPFLILHFSCYTLLTFLMTVTVIMLSMLTILHYTLNENRH